MRPLFLPTSVSPSGLPSLHRKSALQPRAKIPGLFFAPLQLRRDGAARFQGPLLRPVGRVPEVPSRLPACALRNGSPRKRVLATEPSAAQLLEARAHPHVEYRQEAAEAIAVASGAADLLTAAQSAHWFDWPRECRHVDEAYRDLVLPFPLIDAPEFEMQTHWDATAMLGYLDTWSAVRRCRARTGRDPLRLLAGPLSLAWGSRTRGLRWP